MLIRAYSSVASLNSSAGASSSTCFALRPPTIEAVTMGVRSAGEVSDLIAVKWMILAGSRMQNRTDEGETHGNLQSLDPV